MSNSSVTAATYDERRLFEHFVIAGLDETKPLKFLTSSSQECGLRNTQQLAPITDITVIFPQLGEKPPDGFEIIETTTLGYPANLNHGSIRHPSCFLCFRRGYHKQPLVDIGILDEGCGESPMVDSNVVQTTPFGKRANLNNASKGIFLTYRRAAPNASQSQFVVTDIKVILMNKGEITPHTYYKIPKNLNKGMVGSDVFICYKKSQGSAKRLAYKPAVLDYFPRKDQSEEMEDFKLAQNVAMFCLPMGALIECCPTKCQPQDRSFSTFVLTDENGTKFYGSAVTFYEKYEKKLNESQLEMLELKEPERDLEGGTVEDSTSNNDPADDILFYKNLSICLISRYPFFNSFKRFLFFLHRMSLGPIQGFAHSVPIERYISHLMYEVSFPTPRRPRVFMQLGAENISFDSHDDSQLPLNGAQLTDTLQFIGTNNLMELMLLALLEQKILIHSLRPWVLAAVAESVCALMFPFHWQCPYIPQCPLGLAGVLHAPLPFIAGVDSRYYELYEDPPHDVTCFDIDTSTISFSSVRAHINISMLPKKPTKQLKSTLDDIFRNLNALGFGNKSNTNKVDFTPVDQNLAKQRQKREYENEIQSAFLKFMASLMKGYQTFLRPIKSALDNTNAKNSGKLFDLEGFLRSRDRYAADFYKRFSETQSFMRFIEERSFVSDKNTYNAFFDDCIAKLTVAAKNGVDIDTVQLLEPDTSYNYTTSTLEDGDARNSMVFIPSPEPFINPDNGQEMQFNYTKFPTKLKYEYFQLDRLENIDGEKVPIHFEASRCTAVRTKPETRSSLLAATNSIKTNPLHWAKTILFSAYTLWFMQLESLLLAAPNKKKILRLAFNVLDRMERTEIFPLDQVCYRIVIELCGQYDQPAMAVKVLQAMQRAGLEQNAVTYGIYHHAVMGATWPTKERQKAIKMWSVLRIVVNASEAFMKRAKIERRPLITNDTQSISDGGYHSDNKTIGEQVPVNEITVDYEVTYHSLDEPTEDVESDPLGAHTLNVENKDKSLSQVCMSPSRAKFLAEHSAMPFSSESTPKTDKGNDGKSESWLKGIANSPMFKMMRSTTFETPKTSNESLDGSLGWANSPSLNSLVHQVKKGYGDVKDVVPMRLKQRFSSMLMSSVGGAIIQDKKEENPFHVNLKDPAYVMETGESGCLLSEEFWMREVYLQFRRSRERGGETAEIEKSGRMEVILSSVTCCPNCHVMIYDDEIMAAWTVDDQNLNTVCPHCCINKLPDAITDNPANTKGVFSARLTVKMQWVSESKTSWYRPGGLPDSRNQTPEKVASEDGETIQLAFLSPVVLRRELETLLKTDRDAMKKESLKETHPTLFWNLVYYMRRLSLPSHLYSWIAERHHIRCVYDLPDEHKQVVPLYFFKQNHNFIEKKGDYSVNLWKKVITAVQNNKLMDAIEMLTSDARQIGPNGKPYLGPHFPIFRNILFASVDCFGRALIRDNLDLQYEENLNRVSLNHPLPHQDYPLSHVTHACRKIFMPLDLF